VNRGNGQFYEAATALGVDSLADARGLAISDFDNDGDVDMVVSNYRRPASFYINNAARGNWLKIRLRGRDSNRDGAGAIVTLAASGQRQMRVATAGDGYASQFSRVLHFGLGDAAVVDSLRIEWPHGTVQTFENVAANQLIEIDEHRQRFSGIPAAGARK